MPIAKPINGKVASIRAVARGPASCASSCTRTSSATRADSANRSTAAESPLPDAELTCQQAANAANTGRALASWRSAEVTSPSSRKAAKVAGQTGGLPAALSRATPSGCPPRSSAANAESASTALIRCVVILPLDAGPNPRRARIKFAISTRCGATSTSPVVVSRQLTSTGINSATAKAMSRALTNIIGRDPKADSPQCGRLAA
ncbi:unannotated protein [freshwater metagenome]|uniref:Unannotated protein n=1 Tax=freshwater metagenome TaxID=449393 RepID=A0A6J7EAJ4_9ZZZZ